MKKRLLLLTLMILVPAGTANAHTSFCTQNVVRQISASDYQQPFYLRSIAITQPNAPGLRHEGNRRRSCRTARLAVQAFLEYSTPLVDHENRRWTCATYSSLLSIYNQPANPAFAFRTRVTEVYCNHNHTNVNFNFYT